MLWDLFCRVIDNFGDVGVASRLARDLAARGEAVRLWLDDPSALAWMAPAGLGPTVQVRHWTDAAPLPPAGDVVIETFGCDPPPAFVGEMAARVQPPLWINLEYLSAEPYVERSHGLPSPQGAGPGRGLTKWFFYPGFTAATGGLLREPGLLAERDAFDRQAWLAAQGITPQPGERLVSLFCYDTAPLPALLAALASEPTLLLLTPGAAQRLRQGLAVPPQVRTIALPWFSQPDYDRLLWACDINFVRGEDSFVRAMWAGAPFVWQIYPQGDAAHAAKLDAFLALWMHDAAAGDFAVARLFRAWNGLPSGAALALPELGPWRQASRDWCKRLAAQPDLSTRLLSFARGKSLGT